MIRNHGFNPSRPSPREPGPHAVNDAGVYMEDMIMESILGRKLRHGEIPYHRNKNTLDNRDESLYLTLNGVEVSRTVR